VLVDVVLVFGVNGLSPFQCHELSQLDRNYLRRPSARRPGCGRTRTA
jgi:hypothetical protein